MSNASLASQILVIFGASGDLAHRKLIPSLFSLYQQGQLPASFAIMGVGRTELETETYRQVRCKHKDSVVHLILKLK